MNNALLVVGLALSATGLLCGTLFFAYALKLRRDRKRLGIQLSAGSRRTRRSFMLALGAMYVGNVMLVAAFVLLARDAWR